jgi:membrane protease YdiL (CAAX protease family)
MKRLFDKVLGDRLNGDWKITLITIVSTLLIMVDFYYSPTSINHFDSILLFILLPLIVIIVIFKQNPSEYGFVIGEWKIGVVLVLLGIVFMTPVIWYLGTREPGMQSYYNLPVDGLIWKKALELFGWEYLFRGWILFGYARKYGPDAVWLQAVPFAIAHIGKPEIETLSTIFGGFAFGWVAWRTGSFLYSFVIHWYIAVLIILVSTGMVG